MTKPCKGSIIVIISPYIISFPYYFRYKIVEGNVVEGHCIVSVGISETVHVIMEQSLAKISHIAKDFFLFSFSKFTHNY